MAKIDITNMPVEIVSNQMYGGVSLKIGNIPAIISEPDPRWLDMGIVSLFPTDLENGNWWKLVSVRVFNDDMPGFTDDPRLVEIAGMILHGRTSELEPGTIVRLDEGEE
jgi:hypothetical protein